MNTILGKSCIVLLLICLVLVKQNLSLECYVCQNQENNKNKCVETVKICDVNQEQCLSEVRWGSTPYWSLTSQKQFLISKRCATKNECNIAIADYNQKCDRIWYNDWNCTTCCSGDKCNYYVTLGVGSIVPSNFVLLTSALMTSILFINFNSYVGL